MKILIVEDDAAIRLELARFLEKYGYTCLCPADFTGIAAKAAETQPDLALLDINLPCQDGFSLCRQLRESPQTAGLPIIMLTSRSSDFDELLGLRVGADDYVTKPFNPQVLLARIQNLLARTAAPEAGAVLTHKGLTLYVLQAKMRCGDQEAELTRNELGILRLLMRSISGPLCPIILLAPLRVQDKALAGIETCEGLFENGFPASKTERSACGLLPHRKNAVFTPAGSVLTRSSFQLIVDRQIIRVKPNRGRALVLFAHNGHHTPFAAKPIPVLFRCKVRAVFLPIFLEIRRILSVQPFLDRLASPNLTPVRCFHLLNRHVGIKRAEKREQRHFFNSRLPIPGIQLRDNRFPVCLFRVLHEHARQNLLVIQRSLVALTKGREIAAFPLFEVDKQKRDRLRTRTKRFFAR